MIVHFQKIWGSVIKDRLLSTGMVFLIICFSMGCATNRHATSQRQVENWWSGWKFVKGVDPAGASKPDFNDANWSVATLPHDYTMDGPYGLSNATPDSSRAFNKYVTWPKVGSQGYLPRQIGWYRKTFTVANADSGKKVFIEFDGVFRNSSTYLNGVLLGTNYSGYASFVYDLTPYIKFGGTNVLAVQLDATQNEGWWYEGRGIYRPVRLVIADKLHVAKWGTFVATPTVTSNGATVNIKTKVANEYDQDTPCMLESVVLDMNNKIVGTASSSSTIAANGTHVFNQDIKVASPQLWCPENPYLYKAVSKVSRGDIATDEYTTTFGIRTFYFDPDRGFFLNGKHYKLNGVCNHDDYAGLGMAIPKRIHYQNIGQLAAAGVIYLRGAHGARSPDELDACDKYGVMVWAETRYFKNTDFDSQALRDLIDRDRNHPSIILWSLANEDKLQGTTEGVEIGTKLKKAALQEDSTRPITSAIDRAWVLEGTKGDPGYQDIWDVCGYNWIAWDVFDRDHKELPNRKFLVSEYQYNANTMAGSPPTDEFILQRDYIAGSSMWSGFAYKGEETWPSLGHPGSLWDLAHDPMPDFWKARAEYGFQMGIWSVHVTPSTGGWKGKAGDSISFSGWANCEKVEVYINDVLKKTIAMRTTDGTNPWSTYKYLFSKDMAINDVERFVPDSVIKFVGINAGIVVDTQIFKPMLDASRIVVSPNPGKISTAGDVSVVTVTIQDANGNIIADADSSITVNVTGAGTLIGLGSADLDANRHGTEPEKFVNHKFTFQGILKAFVQSTDTPGAISISASGDGLSSGSASVMTVPYPTIP